MTRLEKLTRVAEIEWDTFSNAPSAASYTRWAEAVQTAEEEMRLRLREPYRERETAIVLRLVGC